VKKVADIVQGMKRWDVKSYFFTYWIPLTSINSVDFRDVFMLMASLAPVYGQGQGTLRRISPIFQPLCFFLFEALLLELLFQ
jgi:hypothetical protein